MWRVGLARCDYPLNLRVSLRQSTSWKVDVEQFLQPDSFLAVLCFVIIVLEKMRLAIDVSDAYGAFGVISHVQIFARTFYVTVKQ